MTRVLARLVPLAFAGAAVPRFQVFERRVRARATSRVPTRDLIRPDAVDRKPVR